MNRRPSIFSAALAPQGRAQLPSDRAAGSVWQALGRLAAPRQGATKRDRRRRSRAEREAAAPGGLIQAFPIIVFVAAPFERVAPRILPMNWGACIPAIQTVISQRTNTPTGWKATMAETVRLGPGGARTLRGDFDVEVVEPSSSSRALRVNYSLQRPSETLLRDEGYIAVYPHANLRESHSVLIADKSVQFVSAFDSFVLDGTGLRTVLQLWLAAAASDECAGAETTS